MNIEPLESRIAPAGIVTITQTASDLVFTGDAQANVIALENVLVSGFIRATATAGTMLQFGDQTGTQFDIPLGARKNMRIDLAAGDDELSLTDIQLDGKLEIKGGAGNNTINLSGLMEEEGIFYYLGGDDADTITGDVTSFRAASAKFDLGGGTNFMDYTDDACTTRVVGAFTVLSGSGDDDIQIGGVSGRFGSLTANLGGGTNSYKVILEDVLISSYFLGSGGAGMDTFSLRAKNNLSIGKTFTVNAGDGAAAVEIGAGGALSVRGKTSVVFGKVQPSPVETASLKIGGADVRLGPMNFRSPAEWFAEATCIVAGYVDGMGVDDQTAARTVRMGAANIQGATDVKLNASAITVRGNAVINAPDSADVSLTSGYLDINGNLTATLGNGDGSFVLAGDSIEIAGKLALGFGDGNYTTGIGVAGGSLTAGSIAMVNRTETVDKDETIAIAGRVETIGAFSIVDGAGDANVQFTGVSLDIGKAFTLALGAGDDRVDMTGGSFSAPRFVAGLGGGANAAVIQYDSTDWDFFLIAGGANADAVSLEIGRGILPAMTIDLGAGANNASIESAGGLRIGKLAHVSAAGAGAAVDRLNIEGVAVKDLSANLGIADSILNIARSRVGKLVANLGAGADTMRLDDNLVTGAVTVNTGLGNDSVRIERDADEGGESIFLNRVIFTLSDGDDEVLVADATDETKASFRSIVGVYGDAGTDTFTPHATNATFATTPVLTGIP